MLLLFLMDGGEEEQDKKSLSDLILESFQDAAESGDEEEQEGGFLDELYRIKDEQDMAQAAAEDETGTWKPEDEESRATSEEEGGGEEADALSDKGYTGEVEESGTDKRELAKPSTEDDDIDFNEDRGHSKKKSGGEKGDGSHHETDKGGEKGSGSRDALKKGEESAGGSSANGRTKNSTDLAEKEKSTGSSYTNNVGKKSNAGAMSKTMKTNLSGKKQKKGPFVSIMLTIMSFCGFSFVSMQAATPLHFLENIKTSFSQLQQSNTERSKTFFRYQTDVDNRYIKDCRHKYFNKSEFKIKPESKVAKKLEAQGITFDDTRTRMKFTDSSGKEFQVVTDSAFKKLNAPEIEAGNIRSFTDMYNNHVEFHNAYYDGAKTWRGAVHQWFNKTATKFFKLIGDVGRYVFRGFKQEGEGAEADLQARIKTADEVNVTIKSSNPDDVDSNGKLKADTDSKSIKLKAKQKLVEADVKAKLDSVGGKLSKASGLMSAGTNLICGAFDLISAAALIAEASRAFQAVALATTTVQGFEMSKTEEGAAENPTSTIMADMEKPIKDQTVSLPSSETKAKVFGQPVENGPDDIVDISGSASSATSFRALFSKKAVSSTDGSLTAYSIASAIGRIRTIMGVTTKTHAFCTAGRLVAAAVGAVSDTVKIVSCIVTIVAYGGTCWELLAEAVIGVTVSAVIAVGVSFVVQKLTPVVAKAILVGAADHYLGKGSGEQLADGIMKLTSTRARVNGQSLVCITDDNNSEYKEYDDRCEDNGYGLTSYLLHRDEYIADYAKYQRTVRSPLDIGSQYTYMGSIANKMIRINLSGDTVMAKIGGFFEIAGESVKSLLPGAYAASVSEEEVTIKSNSVENCPELTGIGAVGDQFCNPYVSTDYTTMEEHPAEVVNKVEKNLTKEGKIKEGSDLSYYLTYCGQRTSPFGYVDENISGSVADFASTGVSGVDGAIGGVMVIGDVVSIVQESQKLAWSGYITGAACVTGSDSGGSVPDWDELKNYQRYAEDQALAESMGLIEEDENTVYNYLSEYYEKHPLDNSREGILARYSGLTKDHVVAVLDTMEFMTWLADYNPHDLWPAPIQDPTEEQYQFEDGNEFSEGMIAAIKRDATVYIDHRQRSFAV